ncbi:hypothetical protein [Bacillus bombysepticus]|uniref:hypothetical protein n=1 Tax=Bacillus bombysepticus TaxID=658666 RepID=UPI003015DB8D
MTQPEKLLMDLVEKNGEGKSISILSELSYVNCNYNYESDDYLQAHTIHSIAIESNLFNYDEKAQKVYLNK